MRPYPPRLLFAALALGVGCAPVLDEPVDNGTPPDGAADAEGDPAGSASARLVQVAGCSEVQDALTDAWLESLVQSRYGSWGWLAEGGDVATDGGAPSNDAPDDFSETNVQEAGVDEPDLVKTDGEYLYLAQRGELTIVDSWPSEESHKVSSLPIEGYPYSLFLRGDRALVFSSDYDLSDDGPAAGFRYGQGTRLTVVDVADRAAPTVLREIDIEGWFTNARMIDGDVYTVVQSYTDMPPELWNILWDGTVPLPEPQWEAPEVVQAGIRGQARALLRPFVEQAVAAAGPDAVLPHVVDRPAGEVGTLSTLLGCSDLYRPEATVRPSVLSVVHLDLDAGTAGGAVTAEGLLADGWTVYASQEHLYVAQTSWWWWWGWGDLDLETHIHRFALDGADTVYEGSGAVPGWVLNQFSLGEHDGYLRVATTDVDWWWGVAQSGETEPANNVFVLDLDDGELVTVGSRRGIAPGERIFAARFQGDRGYLVTFEQIDPLFTLDLSDPTAPAVVGILEVTGFSSYLHPVGDDRVISVGMEGTEDGQILGLAVSLFDVSDFGAPALLDRFLIESDDWSWSEALYDHHAFTYFNGVLTLPIYTYEWDNGPYGSYFSGLLALDVDLDQGFTEIGRIDHTGFVQQSECLWYTGEGETSVPCDDQWWYAWVRRGVIIEDALYSISDYGIKVNAIEDPSNELAEVLFWPLGG